MSVNNAVSAYLNQRPVYIINSSEEFIKIAIAEAATCLGISSEEFTEIAPPRILKKIDQIFSEVSCTHKLNQIFERLFRKKSVVELDLTLKFNLIIYSLTHHITQELSSVNVFSYKELMDKSTYLSLLKREAEICYLSKPINYARRVKTEFSLWKFSQISLLDQQIISQFFLALKENHNVEILTTLKENTITYAKYCINLFNTTKSNFDKANPSFFSRNKSVLYTRLQSVLLNAMTEELKLLTKEQKEYFDIKKFYILKSIFYFKMREYFTIEYETKLAEKDLSINFLKKLLQVKINGCTYLIKTFENFLEKEINITPFQDLINEQKIFIKSQKIKREKLECKLITNSENDWLKSEKNTFPFDNDSIDALKLILETIPISHFERKFIRQLNVLYGRDFIHPEKKTSFLMSDKDLNFDSNTTAIEKLLNIIESRDQECLKKTISIEEIKEGVNIHG